MPYLNFCFEYSLIKGVTKSLIYNRLNSTYVVIDCLLTNILIDFFTSNIDIKLLDNNKVNFLKYLQNANICFLSEIKDNNYLIQAKQTKSNKITTIIGNSIIEFSDISIFKECIEQLNKLLIFNVEIRINFVPKLNEIIKIIRILNTEEFNYVSIVFSPTYVFSLSNLMINRVLSIINSKINFYIDFYISNTSKLENILSFKTFKTTKINIIVIEDLICNLSCGKVNSKYFNFSNDFIKRSLNLNSCLHHKISIDAEGNIKNCPSMTESFGNIRDTTLAEAIEKPGFKKYWDINKDKIHVCKDCEYRYICTDCRAYVEDPEDILSKPLKCGYNPYTGEWSEWSTNPLKQKAIDFYGMREMVDDMNKAVTDNTE